MAQTLKSWNENVSSFAVTLRHSVFFLFAEELWIFIDIWVSTWPPVQGTLSYETSNQHVVPGLRVGKSIFFSHWITAQTRTGR